MGLTETLRLLVEADAKGAISEVERLGSTAEREANRSEKALDRWGNRMQSVGTGMMVFGAAALVGLKSAGDAASDLNEVASKSSTVFGEAAGEVDEFASNAADIGLSKRAALEAASGFGNLFDQLGFANDASADMSMSLTQLASDFASFHNADITEVIEAQTAAFRGEYDSLQRFVPTINAAAVEQQAMAETGKENADALTEAEKAAATYTLMIEGAGAATGDFARTGDSAANQQRKLTANWENLKAQLGQGVLPAMQSMLGVTNDVVGGLSKLDAITDGTLGKIATFGAVGLVAAGGLSTVVGKAITMRENLSKLGSALSDMTGKAAAVKGTLVGGGVIAAVVAVGFALHDAAQEAREARFDEVAKDLEETGDAAKAAKDALGGEGPDFTNPFSTVADDVVNLHEVLTRLTKEGNFEEARDLIAEAGERGDISAGQMRALSNMLDQLEGSAEGAAAKQHELAEETRGVTDAMEAQADPVFAVIDADNQLRDAKQGIADALVAVNDAIKEHGENSPEAIQAAQDLRDAQLDAAEAALGSESALRDLAAAAAENPEIVDQVIGRLQGLANQGVIAQGVVDAFSRALRDVPRRTDSTLVAQDRATGIIRSVGQALGAIDGDSATVTINANTIIRSVVEGFGFGGGRARGGPVSGSKLYEVVEDGPELFQTGGRTFMLPGSDGHVVPTSDLQLAAGAGGRGGTTIINVHVAGSVLSERDLIRVINEWTRKGRGLN